MRQHTTEHERVPHRLEDGMVVMADGMHLHQAQPHAWGLLASQRVVYAVLMRAT